MENVEEVKKYLIKYFNKKGIELKNGNYNNELIYEYKVHYSNFKIKLDINYDGYNKWIIKYSAEPFVNNLSRRRTGTKGRFALKVYKTVLFIKNDLLEKAIKNKEDVDRKTKYCSELESYYKRKHRDVCISTREYKDVISITIHCYDNDKSQSYYIEYRDDKYYLKTQSISYKEKVNI